MDAKFRSLPLSLIDFFGVLIPGLAWLILLDTARAILTLSSEAVTPLAAATRLAQLVSQGDPWLRTISIFLIAFVLGNVAKPRAMHLATHWPVRLLPTDSDPSTDKNADKIFPFHGRHCDKPYFVAIERLTYDITGCSFADLPGPQPFGVMKRLLRLIAPPLWEELEHREAEVRLLGSVFLAAVFSAFLSVIEIGREAIVDRQVSVQAAGWFLVSVAVALLAGDGFGHLRRREVEFVYLHTLVAVNAREKGLWGQAQPKSAASSNPGGETPPTPNS